MLEGGERVIDRGDRIAGRLDDDVDLGMRHELAPVVAEVRRMVLERRLERRRRKHRRLPAHALEIGLGVGGCKVGDADEVDARRPRHLREVHGGELARAYQANAQRIFLSLLEFGVKVHIGWKRGQSNLPVTPTLISSYRKIALTPFLSRRLSENLAALRRVCRPSREAARRNA